MWDKMKGVKWAEVAWLLECFSGRFVKVFGKKESLEHWGECHQVTISLLGLAEERPSVRMQGKEINVEQAGTELPWAQEARDPGEEMKGARPPQTGQERSQRGPGAKCSYTAILVPVFTCSPSSAQG